MYLTDFAEQRGVKPNTITAYMLAHAADFEGHTSLDGKRKVLDEVAVELLDAKYPMPKPIQIIQDTEAREQLAVALRELADARGRIGEIYGQLLDAQTRAHQAELAAARVELLEAAAVDKDEQINDLEAATDALQEALKEKEEALAAEAAARAEAEAALEAERSKTWWQRLLGR